MVAIGWFKPRLQWNLLKRCLGAILVTALSWFSSTREMFRFTGFVTEI